MVDSRERLPWRLLFVFICVLVASNLTVLSVSMAKGKSYPGLGVSLSKSTTIAGKKLNNSLAVISKAPTQVAKLASDLTDFQAFIKPAADDRLPVITPLNELPTAQVVPASAPAPAVTTGSVTTRYLQSTTANLYAWGNCTWWVSARRSQINDPIPNTWGNASTWAVRAARDGYTVDHNPSPGAIMQISRTAGGLGHVAFVESVDPDGTWHISEMNVLGLNIVDNRAEPLSAAANENFIHDIK